MPQTITFTRTAQIDDYHCGPAVTQMLLANLGIETTQQEIDKAAGIKRFIRKHGSRPDQLAKAVDIISRKKVKLWFKDHAKLSDVEKIINTYNLPVVIEWQGLFGYKIDPKTNGPKAINDGHYSIVTCINPETKDVTLIDPYTDFINQDRVFKYSQFRKRWWDSNDYVKEDGEIVRIYDYKMLFFLAPVDTKFPKSLKLRPGSEYTASLPL